jgi:hypothetical protein
MKVKDASPEVEKIINAFIDIISEKSQEPTKYQKDLDKKTFRFLLISDTQNRVDTLSNIERLSSSDQAYRVGQRQALTRKVNAPNDYRNDQVKEHQLLMFLK